LWKAVALIPLLAATSAYADAPAAVAPSSPPSLQQLFNQASDAEQKQDCATALPIFDHLVHDPRVKAGSLAAAAIAVRRGHCLIDTGKPDEGEASVEQGLPIMQKAGPEFAGDVAVAEKALGDLAFLRSDQAAAIAHYQAWLAVVGGSDRLYPLLRLAMITAFDGGSQPLAYADEALRIVLAQPKPDKSWLSRVHDIHGRILLNQGQVKPAYAELKEALSLAGGLTYKIHHEDVELRGDLAQAALLNGDRDSARKYLSYTGEGRIAESPFAVAVAMAAPDCGSETGLTPQDSAIVEFSISDDGSISGAQTIYTRGNFAVASAFANAVDKWFWRPEDIARLPPFYRTLTRVEMRCSNGGGNVPSIETPLTNRFFAWASTVLPQPPAQTPFAGARLQELKGLANVAISNGDRQTAAAALGAWAILNPRIGPADLDAFDRAIALGQQAAIPPQALNALRVLRMPRELSANRLKMADWRGYASLSAHARFVTVADGPALADDPLAADTLLMLAVPARPDHSEQDAAITLAQRVADDRRLPEHFPLRQAALLWLANQSAQAGKLAEAQAYFQRTGLNEEQCALIGPEPALRSTGVSSSDYPMEAYIMGFEGWVRLEYNINANGTTADARPLISYPPFVFEDAATKMAKNIRYQLSYRPSGGEACSAQPQSIKFVLSTNR
jgi:tetratricopeptide (TPR) repeat protein